MKEIRIFLLSTIFIFCITSVSAQMGGCTDTNFIEFWTQGYVADYDDGSCTDSVLPGCTDPTAANYTYPAIDDGSCDYNCYLPDSIWVSDTTESSFTVIFNEIVNADYYRIKYREVGSTTWIMVYINGGNSITINNLDIGNTYEYQFKTFCLAGGNSAWSPTYQITTNEIYGCMDDRAANYNTLATTDDGSCDFSCIKRYWAKNISDVSNGLYINKQLADNHGIILTFSNWGSTSFLDTFIINSTFKIGSLNSNGNRDWFVGPDNITGWPDGGVYISNSFYISESNEWLFSFNADCNSFTIGDAYATLLQDGDENVGIFKLNSNGSCEFIKTVSNYGSAPEIKGLSNEIYLAGSVISSQLLNTGFSHPSSVSSEYGYLQKLDENGDHIFTRYFSVPLIPANTSWINVDNLLTFSNNSIYVELHTEVDPSGGYIIVYNEITPIDTITLSPTSPYSRLVKFNTSGDFIASYNDSYYWPNEVFLDNLLNITGDTIFELDTANLNVIGTHIYPGLSDVQINDDQMILTVGSQMLIVDDNFNTIDTIAMVGLYNDGAVYIHNDGGLLGDTVITATGLNMAKYDIYPIHPSQEPVTCSEWMDGAVSVNPSLGIPPYTYQLEHWR